MKKLLLSLIIIFNSVISALSMNYDKEWKRVDDLMDRVKLKDAQTLVEKIKNVAEKEGDNRQLLYAEIYSYAIDMGCEYSLKNKTYIHRPNNFNSKEGPQIIESHYDKSIKLLDRFGESAEKYLCQFFIASLVEHYIGLNRNSSSSSRDIADLSLGEMGRPEQTKLLDNLYSTLVNSLDKLDMYKAKDYSDFFSMTEEDSTLADVVVLNILNSHNGGPYSDYVTIDKLENPDGRSTVDLFLTNMILLQKKKGNTDVMTKYELMRINEFRKHCNLRKKKDVVLRILDSFIAMYPNAVETIKVEAIRADLLLKKYDENSNKPDAESLEELESRLLRYKDKFKDEQLLEPINEVLDRLHRHILNCTLKNVYHSSEPIRIRVSNANVKKVVVTVKKSSYTSKEYQISQRLENGEYYFLSDSSKRLTNVIPYDIEVPLKQDTFSLSKSLYQYLINDTLSIGNLDYGAYLLKIKDVDNPLKEDSMTFVVSDIAVVTGIYDYNYTYTTKYKRDSVSVYTVDYLSGKPIGDILLYYDGSPVSSEKTSSDGKVYIKRSEIIREVEHKYENRNGNKWMSDIAVYPGKGDDGYGQQVKFRTSYSRSAIEGYVVSVMTDRAIYRPGQTVKFWGFCSYADKENDCLVKNRTIHVSVSNEGDEIKTFNLKTNDFGKFYGKFKIDKSDDAIGDYKISCEATKYASASFIVEDYKLPQFEVEFDKANDRYQIKDSVTISGKVRYYSGEPVLDAKVDLSIESEDYELTTDSLGNFSAIFVVDEEDLKRERLTLDLEAEVTSPSGEVVEVEKEITLYRDNLSISCYPSQLNLSKNAEWKVYSSGYGVMNKDSLSAEIIFVSKRDGKEVERRTKLLNGTAKFDLSKLPLGDYKVIFIDSKSGDTLKKDNVVVYDSRSNVNPVESSFWVSNNYNSYISENETFECSIASNDSDAYVLYLFADNDGNILTEEWINLKNELRTFKFSYDDLFTKDRDKAYVVTFFVYKNGKYTSKRFCLHKTPEYKCLNANIKRLRDKIQAGSRQKWTIEIEGSKLPMSLAATMYDAALDVYKTHTWAPNIARYSTSFYNPYDYYKSFNTIDNHTYYKAWLYPYQRIEETGYSLPVWFINKSIPSHTKSIYTSADFKEGKVIYGYVKDALGNVVAYSNVRVDNSFVSVRADRNGYYEIYIPSKGCDLVFSEWSVLNPKKIFVDKSQRLDVVLDYPEDELIVNGYGVQKKCDVTGSVSSLSEIGLSQWNSNPNKHINVQESDVKGLKRTGKCIRSNFSETAFFFPDIRTRNGKATIDFDAPESVTRWNIKIISLTQKLDLGNDEFMVRTAMPFTVRPLIPRVFRSGDTCVVAASITSNEGKTIRGKAKFLFEDNKTNKVLVEKAVDFAVSANKIQTVECQFVVPDDVESVRLTVTADGPKYSDGELHLVPVVKNKSKVIKANSSLVRKGETKELSVDADETNNVDLTFEYVPNSVWQAILAMPSVKMPLSPNAMSYTMALYVNSIVSYIASNNPSIRKTLKKWKSDPSVMESPLLKDDELKSVSIEASPWKLEALDETEQRAKVVDLMDDANTDSLINDCLDKLKKFQKNYDGGFSWFMEGEKSSEYVTVCVVRYLTKLHQQNLLTADGEQMLKKALPSVDNYLLKKFNRCKDRCGSLKATNFELMMMFSRLITQDIVPVSKDLKQTFDFVIKNTEEHWHDLTLFGKACFVRILVVLHKDSLAKEIVEAMRQTYTQSESMGIYWNENHDYFSWYNNSIAVHSEAVRAFIESGMATEEEIAEMLLWLLKKRETTVWRSPVATVDVIDLLVCTSSLNTAGGKITLPDGKTIETEEDCAFVKRSLSSKDLKNAIKVEGPEDCIGFASIYASYDADNSKITPASNQISIKKKTYRHEKRKGDDGSTEDMLTEVKDGDVVNVGDKLEVILTVENEQDLDFVMVKDERPACLEPQKEISGYKWRNGCSFYQIITDTDIRFFFDRLYKGNYNLSYTLFVQAKGVYSSGISTAECMYSPSFRCNSDCGVKIRSERK